MQIDSTAVFRENVKLRLAELGWQQGDLAAALEVSPSVITSIMKGGGMTLERLDRWASALGVTASQLITPKSKAIVLRKSRAKSTIS
jgi:transcriptional regulator with XRE-family HTH domain